MKFSAHRSGMGKVYRARWLPDFCPRHRHPRDLRTQCPLAMIDFRTEHAKAGALGSGLVA